MDRYTNLNEFAREFRNALDCVVKKGWYGRLTLFECFPKGCCRYASDLLAEYFVEKGIEIDRVRMVEGESAERGYTHCWLIVDNEVYVDITADQFNEKSYFQKYKPIPSYYVVPCRDRSIYELFDNEKKRYLHRIGIDSYDGDISRKLHEVYEVAIQLLDKNLRG